VTTIDSHVQVPSAAELIDAMKAFDEDWGAVDEVLYRVCRELPDHKSRRSITAKVALIGRTYSAGLERRVSPPPGLQAMISSGR
jgi:hypothetical protein